jgi:DNA polymerase-3 subunit delta'
MPFRDIIGHRRLVALLSRSIQRGTLPPSLILAGPSGVGKRLVAVATAQALNCTGASQSGPFKEVGQSDPLRGDACGTCAACTRIARGVHADVLIVEPGDSGSIKIDQVRDIVERAGYRPFEGRRRVVIIDEADALVAPAQNALLKTLEEPPSSSVFLLVTSLPDLLLATVRSRCPRLQFRPLGADEVAAGLVMRGWTEVEARAVAATAEGSIGRALQASAADFVEARDAAVRVLAHAASGADRRGAGSVGNLDSAKALLAKTGKGGASDREQLAVHLRAMASLLRDVEVLGTGASGYVLANPDVRPALERLSAFRGDRGVRAFAAVDRALAALDRNAGVKIVADWLTLNL